MTTPTDFDRQLLAWLETAGPATVRDDVVDGAVAVAAQVGQRRSTVPLLRSEPWPRHRQRVGAKAPVLVLLAVALAGAALLTTGSMRPPRTAETSSVPPASLPLRNATTPPVPAAVAPLPGGLAGTWLGEQHTDTSLDGHGGPATLRLAIAATTMTIASATLRDGDLFTTTTAGDGGPALITVRTTSSDAQPDVAIAGKDLTGCAAGDEGHYAWRIATTPDGIDSLRLDLIDDACPARAAILPGRWMRSLLGGSHGGTALVTASAFVVRATLPPGHYTAEGSDSGWAITDRGPDWPLPAPMPAGFGSAGLDVLVDPRIVADACRPLDGVSDATSSTAEFLAALAANPDLAVIDRARVSLDGATATRVTIRYSGADCPGSAPKGWQAGAFFDVDTLTTVLLVDDSPHVLVIVPHGSSQGVVDGIIGSIALIDSLGGPTP